MEPSRREAPGPPALDHSQKRQEALRRYHILDTAPEREFDRVTRLVAQTCRVPTVLITLLDEERQWFKSCFGYAGARETGIDVSFCAHAVHQRELLVVEDATQDPRFRDNPLVTGEPGWRFYAGAPLETPEGVMIGTLCIVDYEPRVFGAEQRAILEDLADLVVGQFELRSAEAQYRKLFEGHPQPAFIYDADTLALLDANAAAAREYGYAEEEMETLALPDLVAPVSLEEHAARAASAPFTAQHRRKDGTALDVEVREESLLYDGRQARMATVIDVADRARGRQYQRLVENIQEIVFETDLDGKITFLNGAWERLTGFSVKTSVGASLLRFVHSKDRLATLQKFTPLLQRRRDLFRHQTRLLTEAGAELPVTFRARLITGEDGTPVGAVGTLTPLAEDGLDDEPAFETPDARSAPDDDALFAGLPERTGATSPEAMPTQAPSDDLPPDIPLKLGTALGSSSTNEKKPETTESPGNAPSDSPRGSRSWRHESILSFSPGSEDDSSNGSRPDSPFSR